ncbi:MAG: LysR family transcriptional regulator [Psychromonas sp.]
MNISDFDLNTLKTLLVLLQVKNTNKAAELLNTSQPAISRTLAKLRESLDDPLFLRESRGLKLTPKAEQLAVTLPKLFEQLELALIGDVFRPDTLTGTLKIALNEFIMETHGYQLFQAIQKDAPNLNVELHSFSPHSSIDLISGELDLAVSFYPLEVSKSLQQVHIGKYCFAGICRVDHPQAGQTLVIEELFSHYLAGLIIPADNTFNMLVQEFNKISPPTKAMLRSQQIKPLLRQVLASDVIFIAPTCLLNNLSKDLYSLIQVQDSEQRNIKKLGVIYNSKFMQSAKFKWLENITERVLASELG